MSLFPTKTRENAIALIRTLWECEREGRFEDGLLEISENWVDPDFRPSLIDLPEFEASSLLLRFASLLGYQGHVKKIKNSQLRARDLLTEAHGRFTSLGAIKEMAECENHISLTYWRTGELREATAWAEMALSHGLPVHSFPSLSSVMIQMLVNIGERRFDSNVRLFGNCEGYFCEHGDALLNGSFYLNAGIGFIEVGSASEALRCLELSKYYYESGGILNYLGAVENELAHVYKTKGKVLLAHKAVDNGIRICREIGDHTREGFLYDTKAQIYLEEGKFEAALRTIESAVSILKESENTAFLSETLLTEAKILLKLDNFTAAVGSLFEAVEIAKANAGEATAKWLVEQFETALKELYEPKRKKNSENNVETGDLELVLPPSIAHYRDYQGIRINNNHLECAGIRRGSLVVVVGGPVARGDLVAISENETGSINCGFYDADFGIVSLEGCDSELQLFNEDSVQIIGKIVGVCDGTADAEGKLIVEPLAGRREP